MPDRSEQPDTDAPLPRRLAAPLAGLGVALVLATALGLVEAGAAAVLGAGRFGGGFPRLLAAAAFGKAALTHLIVWTPLLVVGGLIIALRSRGREPAERPSAVPSLAAVGLVCAGLTVVVVDLIALHRDRWPYLACGAAAVVAGGGLVWWLLRAVQRKVGLVRFERWFRVKVGGALVLLIGGVACLWSSPLADSGRVHGLDRVAWYAQPATDSTTIQPTRPGRPNIVLIVLDTVRADRLGLYGHERDTTPNLSTFARRAVVYGRAITPGIWTVPGHASLFTGLSTREHGADVPQRWLDSSRRTLAEALAERGYTTAAFTNNPWVSPQTNLSRGFQTYVLLTPYRHLARFSLELLGDLVGMVPPLPWLDGDYGAGMTNRLVEDWLDASDRRPFFLFINYMEAHAPYRVPRRYRAMYMNDAQVRRSYALRMAAFPDKGDIADVLHFDFNIEGAPYLSAGDRDTLARQYDAAIRYLDDRVGQVLEMLRRRRLLDETLVIITADHGEYLGEHGMWAHTFLAYEGVTHVPLIVREPGRTQAAVVLTPARLADVWPTVMTRVAGAPMRGPGFETRDLLDMVAEPAEARLVVTQYGGSPRRLLSRIAASTDPQVKHRGRPQLAIQDGRWKLMVSDDGLRELYDLRSDPGELHNLIDTQTQVAERLATALEQWKIQVPHFVLTRRAQPRADRTDVMRELRALGYAGGDETADQDDATGEDRSANKDGIPNDDQAQPPDQSPPQP